MKEFERNTHGAPSPDLREIRVPEFRQALRADLLRTLDERGARRTRLALAGMGSATLVLAALLALAILRPGLPALAHDALFGGSGAAEPAVARIPAGSPGLGPFTTRAAAPARPVAGRSDPWLAGSLEPAQIKAMEEERFFAVRRYKLNSGERVVVFKEVGGEPLDSLRIPVSAVREF